MQKKFVILYLLLLTACSEKDHQYYSTHPKALQQALQRCPHHSPASVSCDTLKQIALHINDLAYELRRDQLAYGKGILALQEQQIKNKRSLELHPEDDQTKNELTKISDALNERLFIVKWLESPKGSV